MLGKKAKGKEGYPETLYVRKEELGIFKWSVCEDGRDLGGLGSREAEVAEYRLVRKVKVRTIVEVEQWVGHA